MASWVLLTASAFTILLGAAHSYLGERFILQRLFRRPLPPLFGSDAFTTRTLRFAWHALTVMMWGLAAILAAYASMPLDAGALLALRVIAASFLVTAIVTAVISRGQHLSWVVELVIVALVWRASVA